MTITFTPQFNIKEVEVEGFGTIKVRPYGAGEELQISKNLRELDQLQKQALNFLEKLKADYADDESKIPEQEKKKFEKMQNKVTELSNELNQLIRGTISSDEPGVADRVFNELPIEQIRKLVSLTRGEANAEAQ